MEPLLSRLEAEGLGFLVRGRRITSLAFADDVAILTSSYQGMIHSFKMLNQFYRNTSLWVNVKKTKGFRILPVNETYVVNPEEKWGLGEDFIDYIQPGQTERYLGARIDPWIGVDNAPPSENID